MAIKIQGEVVIDDDKIITVGSGDPASPVDGMIRFNSSTNQIERYSDGNWKMIANGVDASQVVFDNSESGLPATNVKDAIDALNILVFHGTNSDYERPANYAVVLWRGTAIPANPIGGDLWDETQTFYSPDAGIWTYDGNDRLWKKGTDTVSVDWVSEHTVAAGGTVELNFGASTGDRTIDWGDGTVEVVNTAAPGHTYTNAGTYQVRASGGTTTALGNQTLTDNAHWRSTLDAVRSWGDLGWTSFAGACAVVQGNFYVPRYIPSGVTTMSDMFFNTPAFNQPIGNWDTSNVTNMYDMFRAAVSFNQPIGDWNVSSVTTMGQMFYQAFSFNQPIGNWNVSNVKAADAIFAQTPFNQDISSWDVSSVTNMVQMFELSNAFQQPLNTWDFTGTVDLTNFMRYKSTTNSYNTADYDDLLVRWDELVTATTLDASRTTNMGGAKYTDPGAGATARTNLVNAGWTIVDGGPL